MVDLLDADGGPLLLGEPTGRWQLISFWASWCGPCRQQGPLLQALVERHRESVELTRVDIGDGEQAAAEPAAAPALPGAAARDGNGLARAAYQVDALPLSLVLDGDGVVVYRGTQLPTDANLEDERP